MDSVLADLRYATRHLVRRPGFSALAVLTLAIGLGLNTVAFTAVNALLFHPFAFAGVDRLGWVMLSTPGNPHGQVSLAEFLDLERHARAFDAVAVEGRRPLALTVDGRAEQVWTLMVSSDYFRALGARAEAGRVIDGSDAARDDLVALVSHRFWQQRLDGGSIAGQTVTIANRSVSVVGVLPDGFQGPGGLFAPDVWLPLERAEAFGVSPGKDDERWLTAIARLADGATVPQVEADLAAVTTPFAPPRDPRQVRERHLAFFAMRDGHPELRGLAPFVWVAMAIVGVVLLIACFNVAGLLLTRATERRREIGIRTVLGAGRLRIVRQLITEGFVLAILSGAAALVTAEWSGTLLAAFSLPAPIPQRLNLHVDARIVGVTALMVLVTGVLPGLVPALQATRRDLVGSMRLDAAAGGGRPSRARNLFVIAQIAGSTLFLATALLFVRSFLSANSFDPGFNTTGTVVAELQPATFGFEGAAGVRFLDELTARVAAVPGQSVAVADRIPFAVGYPRVDEVSTAARDCAAIRCEPIREFAVGRRYFDTIGIPLRGGRDFTEQEAKAGGAVIVSESMAKALWPGRSPLGEPVRIGEAAAHANVVGVVSDVIQGSFGEPARPVFYLPLRETDIANGITLVVRGGGPPAIAIGAIRDTVHALAPAMPVASVMTMKERLDLPLWPRRTAAGFFLVCGGLALVLATVGLFGVTYFAVRQRTREFGVRIALGARASDVVRQVLLEGVWLVAPGAGFGLIAAAVVARGLASALLGVGALDPLSFGATAVTEVLVALAACALPAIRATQVDPMIALRDN